MTDRVEVRTFVKQVENVISRPKSSAELVTTLMSVNNFVNGHGAESSHGSTLLSFTNVSNARQIFLDEFYGTFVRKILDQLTVEWISKFQTNEFEICFDKLLCSGNLRAVFIVLNNCIDEYRQSYQLNKCVAQLEKFLQKHLLASIFLKECAASQDLEKNLIWDSLINLIATLPDRCANKLQKENRMFISFLIVMDFSQDGPLIYKFNSQLFYPNVFIPLVSHDVFTTLTDVHVKVKEGKDINLEFISRLIGKLCISGYSDLLWNNILAKLVQHVKADFVWCRICERIVTGVPDRCIESVLVALLKLIPWYGLVEKFLGDSVLKKQKIQYLLCTKLLLFRPTEQVLVLQNIIGYLASSHTRTHLFIQTFKELLKVWGDSSAIKHTSVEQHVYITKSLFICLGFLKDKQKEEHREELLRMLMPGVQCHIGCTDYSIRRLGMAFAEKFTSVLDPKGPQLSFEYEKTDEINSLFALCIPPADPGIESLCKDIKEVEICEVDQQIKADILPRDVTVDPDLDSDDDLVPYDMSHDVKVTKVKQPKYIRDCMEGLISVDDPERLEVCLKSTESLIRKQPDGLDEIAEELAKILLHLTDRYTTACFTQMRFGSLVGLTVIVPVQVSDYLTKEFYERNYNLRQRMDILEVLAAATQELSKPSDVSTEEKGKEKKIVELKSSSSEESASWRDFVQKRIDSKTRRFGKGRSQPEPKLVINKFSNVAGHFFYPLLRNFDRKENTFDLLGEDSLVLGRLVYTLGVIMHAAVNTPGAKQMGSTLLEFLWVLRFHTDQIVRHAILFACSMIFLSVPCHILMSDLQQEVVEAKSWLEDVVEKDPNTESKKLAVQCLVLLENLIKQEFNKGTEPP